MAFNRTDVSFFIQVNRKVWKKNCPNFLYIIWAFFKIGLHFEGK